MLASYFSPPSIPGPLHLQFGRKRLEKLIYCISPICPCDIAVERRRVLPIMWIPPSELPVNDADHFVATNNDIGRVEITVSEDRRRPRCILHGDHLLDSLPLAFFDVVFRACCWSQPVSKPEMEVLDCLERPKGRTARDPRVEQNRRPRSSALPFLGRVPALSVPGS